MEEWTQHYYDKEKECMSRDELETLQGQRLFHIVEYVYENVAFYKKKMDECGVEPGDIQRVEDVQKLPFTTKEDLRENYPFGLQAAPDEKISRIQGSSGTTGKMTLVPYTQNDADLWGECVARCLAMAGLTKEDRLHVCYGYGLFTGGLGLDFGARKLGATVIPMSSGNTQRQLMMLEDLGATAIACTPSYALYLGEAAKEAGVMPKLKLRAGIHGAEPWTEEMREELESLYGYHAFDIYGLCEILGPGVAQDCVYKKGMHVWEDYFLPEVLHTEDHTPCEDGELGELVFTTLTKEGMPLIRYRTKDLTTIDHSPCECGRTMARISKFKGRVDDMKVIRGVNVFPTEVETVLLGLTDAGVTPHYQMVVDRENNTDRLTVMTEVTPEAYAGGEAQMEALRKKVSVALKNTLGLSVDVKLVEPKGIVRSEGKAVRVVDNRHLV